jgi:hypothetical protein
MAMTGKIDLDEATLAIGRCRTLLDIADAKINVLAGQEAGAAAIDDIWMYVEREMRRHLAEVDRALGHVPPEDKPAG